MRRVTLLVSFLVTTCVYSQSFKLYESSVDLQEGNEITDGKILSDTCTAEKNKHGALYALGEMHAILENISDSNKMVVCKTKIVQMLEGAKITFCWGGLCGNEGEVVSSADTVKAKEKVYGFSADYTAPLVPGTSTIRFTFYDEDDVNDSVSVVYEFVTIPGLRTFVYANDISLSVYPNPAIDNITLTMSNLQLEQASLVLYDATGRIAKTQLLISNSTKMDVSNLEQGAYYLQILNNKKTVGICKFVKK